MAGEAGVTVLAFPGPQVKVAPAPDDPPRLVPSLLPAVEVTVERTVARWLGLSARPSRLDWPRLLVGAMQHRVEGLCVDALRALAWDELAPPSVVDTLERRALLAESRFLAHYHALQELRDLDEELVASLVLLNGAALVGDYTSSTHRMVGDVDVYVDTEHAGRLGERARRLGYWEKDGESGPTYYKDVATGVPGAGYVGIDVHLTAPADGISDGLAAGHWADNLVPHVVGDVKVHRPTPALELTHLLVRLHEHAGSWAGGWRRTTSASSASSTSSWSPAPSTARPRRGRRAPRPCWATPRSWGSSARWPSGRRWSGRCGVPCRPRWPPSSPTPRPRRSAPTSWRCRRAPACCGWASR